MSAGLAIVVAIVALIVGGLLVMGYVLRTIKRSGERR